MTRRLTAYILLERLLLESDRDAETDEFTPELETMVSDVWDGLSDGQRHALLNRPGATAAERNPSVIQTNAALPTPSVCAIATVPEPATLVLPPPRALAAPVEVAGVLHALAATSTFPSAVTSMLLAATGRRLWSALTTPADSKNPAPDNVPVLQPVGGN